MSTFTDPWPTVDRSLGSRRFARRGPASERGANLVEYILLITLIALAVVGAVVYLASRTSDKFTDAGNAVKGVSTASNSPCGADTVVGSDPGEEEGTWYVCRGPGGLYGVFRP